MEKTTKNITIERMLPDDVEEALDMHVAAWLDTYPNEEYNVSRDWVEQRIKGWYDPNKIKLRKERIAREANNPHRMWRVARDNKGKIVGIVTPHRDEKEQRVGSIYISKDYYGSGLAQRLMNEIIDWSDQSRPLELEVAVYNERAQKFYRKYGFEEIPGQEHLIADKIPVIRMTRKGDRQ